MRRILTLALVAAMLSGCSSSGPRHATLPPATTDPCQDMRFLALQTRPVDQMTEEERTFYLEMSRLCLESQRMRTTRMEAEVRKNSDMTATLFAIFGVGLIGGAVWYFLATDNKDDEKTFD